MNPYRTLFERRFKVITILGILNERGYLILGYESQEEQQIQREKDLIKLLEENNRLLKENKNK